MIDNLIEAISHAKEVAEEQRKKAERNIIETTKEGWIRVYDGKEYNDCLECARDHEQLVSWLTELQERREADRWIPVSERLPKSGNKAYLVTVDYGLGVTTSCQRFFFNDEIGWNDDSVIAWKPLPEPYKENDK